MRNVRDIMSKDCVTAKRNDSLYEIAVKMKENDIGFIPVLDGKKMVGVVTDRDLVLRGYAEKHSGSETVDKVMTSSIRTASPDMSVDDAAQLMADQQIRRLPIVENGELVGIVSLGDLAIRHIFVNEAGQALSEISENHYVH